MLTVSKLLWRGHRSSVSSLVVILVALVACISGIVSVAINSSEKAGWLKTQGAITTEVVKRVNTLDGISVFTTLVASIAIVVALLMLSAITQFTIASSAPTMRSLRTYGVSRFQARSSYLVIISLASMFALVVGVVLSPLAASGQKFILARTGLNVDDVSAGASFSTICYVSAFIWVFVSVVALLSSNQVCSLEPPSANKKRTPTFVRRLARCVLFVAFSVALAAILRVDVNMENINQVTFGALFTSLIALWLAFPWILKGFARILKRAGDVGLALGGLIFRNANRVSAIALISALLLGLGGTSAILTLASSTAGKFLAMNSISADAVSDKEVKSSSADIHLSPLDFDGGWIYKDQDAKQAPVLLFDPSVIAGMLASDTIVDGDLQRVGRDDVVADAKRYKIGDKVEIANDAGASRELRVVALANSNSLLGGSFGADASSFVPSSDSQVSHRTYATASGGYDHVSRALPDGEWQTIPEYVEGDLRSVQESQRASVFAMIGGVAVVAFCGMMYSVVGFSVDLRPVSGSLRRVGMGTRARYLLFVLIGLIIAAGSAVMAGAGLVAALSQVADVFGSLGITYPLDIPWGLLSGIWLVSGVLTLIGMIAGQKKYA